jgi:hypothetical protein
MMQPVNCDCIREAKRYYTTVIGLIYVSRIHYNSWYVIKVS